MPELEALHKEQTIEVEYVGEIVKVTFRPGKVTTRWERELRNARLDPPDDLYRLLCEVVTGWDLTVGGKPLPVTVESLDGTVPAGLIVRILWAIYEYNLAKKVS